MKTGRCILWIALFGLVLGIVCIVIDMVPLAGIIWAITAMISGIGIRTIRKSEEE